MTDNAVNPIRSPSYPSLGLREAVANVAKIERSYRASPVDRVIAAKQIGYKSLSGPATKSLAALASFGLLERAGKGETRVTERARAILYAESNDEKLVNLIAASKEPALFREIQERFAGLSIPPEDGVINYLNRQGFNPNATRPAAKAFLETMQYLDELGAFDKDQEDQDRSPDEDDEVIRRTIPNVGDLVQWETGGVLNFPHPIAVRAVSDDGRWVFVDGSETGVPTSEVTVEKPAGDDRSLPPKLPLPNLGDGKEEAGEVEWMRSPLTPETSIRLMVRGEIGPREIARLIRLLETQKLILEED